MSLDLSFVCCRARMYTNTTQFDKDPHVVSGILCKNTYISVYCYQLSNPASNGGGSSKEFLQKGTKNGLRGLASLKLISFGILFTAYCQFCYFSWYLFPFLSFRFYCTGYLSAKTALAWQQLFNAKSRRRRALIFLSFFRLSWIFSLISFFGSDNCIRHI